MADLKPLEKRFLVERLAVYTSIADTIEAFEKEFPKRPAPDRKQVSEYGLDKSRNREKRGEDLVKLWDETRKAYLEETKDIPIAFAGWRLRELQDLYETEKKGGYRKSAKATLEQAAKERGGLYTNRHELTGKDGAPLPAPPPTVVAFDLSRLSREELTILEKLHERHAAESGEHPQGEG